MITLSVYKGAHITFDLFLYKCIKDLIQFVFLYGLFFIFFKSVNILKKCLTFIIKKKVFIFIL